MVMVMVTLTATTLQVINGQLKATFSTDWAEQFSSCEDEALGSVFTACFGEGDEESIRRVKTPN